MTKNGRPGTVTLTFEVPIEVAEWLASNALHLEQLDRLEINKARIHSEANNALREKQYAQRQEEFLRLGREGYRRLRQINGGKNLQSDRASVHQVASDLGVDWRTLETAVVRFKKQLSSRIKKRRIREVHRLHKADWTNVQIAARYKVTPVTVGRYLQSAPQNHNTLKNKEKGVTQGNSQGHPPVIHGENIELAGSVK